MKFVEVNGESENFHLVEKQFEVVIKPIYGTHPRLLDDIRNSSPNRKCLLLFADQNPVGILIFNTGITEERKDSKYPAGCFVIKTLFVINSTANSGNGYGTSLMVKAIEEAEQRKASSIYATVSGSIPAALEFFEKKGFKKFKDMEGKFQTGVTEYALIKTLM